MHKGVVFGAIAAAVIAAIAIGVALAVSSPSSSEASSDFPITVDFARVIPYENLTTYPDATRGYVMHVRLLYGEEGAPRPFYMLFSPQQGVWDQVTDPERWVREGIYGNHGFEVLSSSKEFDLFTEYFPFDAAVIPKEIRLYCPDCAQKWSEPQIVWQGIDNRITKLKGVIVHEGPEFYQVGFALGNDQIDTLPATGILDFRITDSLGVTLYETRFAVKATDFERPLDDPIKYLRVPLGGKAFYTFTIPTEEIKSSPTGKMTGFAVMNFTMEDGTSVSGGTRDVPLPVR